MCSWLQIWLCFSWRLPYQVPVKEVLAGCCFVQDAESMQWLLALQADYAHDAWPKDFFGGLLGGAEKALGAL